MGRPWACIHCVVAQDARPTSQSSAASRINTSAVKLWLSVLARLNKHAWCGIFAVKHHADHRTTPGLLLGAVDQPLALERFRPVSVRNGAHVAGVQPDPSRPCARRCWSEQTGNRRAIGIGRSAGCQSLGHQRCLGSPHQKPHRLSGWNGLTRTTLAKGDHGESLHLSNAEIGIAFTNDLHAAVGCRSSCVRSRKSGPSRSGRKPY